MKIIYKYELAVIDEQDIEMPWYSQILSFQCQNNRPVLWVLVDPELMLVKRRFRLVGTGHPVENDLDHSNYIGTVKLEGGGLVFHLFHGF